MTQLMSYAEFSCKYEEGTFEEYLQFIGVEKPDLKVIALKNGGFEYRYSRLGVEGDWCPSRKDAKESYKMMLKAKRDLAKHERHAVVIEFMPMNDCDLHVLREAVGADVKRPWLERNFLLPDTDSASHEAAIRLVAAGLANDLGPHNNRTLYEVTPKGCQVAGVPETHINNHRFMR